MDIPRPVIPDKALFNMGEACRVLQLPAHTLRYWESRVPSLRPARLASGHRRYTRRHLEAFFQLKDLLREGRTTLAGARRILAGERRARPAGPAPGAADGAQARLLKELREDLRAILAEFSR